MPNNFGTPKNVMTENILFKIPHYIGLTSPDAKKDKQ
jgi:hypothetical protein